MLKKYSNIKWLTEHYINQKLSAEKCAKIANVEKTTILRWLKYFKIPRRKRNDYNYDKLIEYNNMNKIIISKEWLIENYINKKLSCNECAKIYGCSATHIRDMLIEYEIKLRECTEKAHELIKEKIKQGNFILQLIDKTGNNNYAKRADVREKIRQSKIGSKNPMWNPNITDEERKQSRNYDEYVQWRKQIFERDNYTCQYCGNKNGNGKRVKLAAHHKDGHHWCKEKRLDINNGVTLCWDCHAKFHKIYGTSKNTYSQFVEFMKNKI